MDLSQVNFSKAQLQGAIFKGAKLNGANLEAADLTDADLNEADLSDANLEKAVFGNNVVQTITLGNVNLRSSTPQTLDVNKINLIIANLKTVQPTQPSDSAKPDGSGAGVSSPFGTSPTPGTANPGKIDPEKIDPGKTAPQDVTKPQTETTLPPQAPVQSTSVRDANPAENPTASTTASPAEPEQGAATPAPADSEATTGQPTAEATNEPTTANSPNPNLVEASSESDLEKAAAFRTRAAEARRMAEILDRNTSPEAVAALEKAATALEEAAATLESEGSQGPDQLDF